MPKQARLRGIKSFRTYTINEAAGVTGVSPRTVRSWVAKGLAIMDKERPALVRGDDLLDFIKAQRQGRKAKTASDEFYCVRCRQPQQAAGRIADCNIKGRRAMLTALCEVCETVLSKPIAEASIPEIAQTLDLTIKRHETAL
ncbi:helix-turn-helix domain-containing protein [Pseudovibrio sp. Alg231-02]|uniref:helix-turn-helix domain-containing protein n=1 Tax=Pseudovibrio sp. Alg231-02 TaxID=1922223 RepID=UPI000D54D508|nr:helix-turn-helix domain-containing protein [Pseudovibrio sp. Alg231-02]